MQRKPQTPYQREKKKTQAPMQFMKNASFITSKIKTQASYNSKYALSTISTHKQLTKIMQVGHT